MEAVRPDCRKKLPRLELAGIALAGGEVCSCSSTVYQSLVEGYCVNIAPFVHQLDMVYQSLVEGYCVNIAPFVHQLDMVYQSLVEGYCVNIAPFSFTLLGKLTACYQVC
ncbi:hypothetical protein RRG08_007506 [Elysia crispata]|uniref:Uncharacterized protein n=1 Tax=Elysia crispata TaxID=231223 RepID=A0AAE1DFK1_9GAST|nr:hypothetical protein RRG08_007506 [Elysia crispata]